MINLYACQRYCGFETLSQNVSTNLSTENVDKLAVKKLCKKVTVARVSCLAACSEYTSAAFLLTDIRC